MRRLDTAPYSFAVPDEPHLRALYLQAVQQPDAMLPALGDSICVFTRRARNEGVPVERIIAALKDTLRGDMNDAASHASDGGVPSCQHVFEDAVSLPTTEIGCRVGPATECYPCPRTAVLPMSPVCTTPVASNVALQLTGE